MSSVSPGLVAVVGATGHTARFVLDELERRGFNAILIGRDAEKLAAMCGVRSLGEIFDAREFLESLVRGDNLQLAYDAKPDGCSDRMCI